MLALTKVLSWKQMTEKSIALLNYTDAILTKWGLNAALSEWGIEASM